jgi:hypothetical protein
VLGPASLHGSAAVACTADDRGGTPIEVHHRPMLPSKLANELAEVAGPLGPVTAHGLFVDNGAAHANLGQFAEQIAAWSFEVVSALQTAMLALPQVPQTLTNRRA